MNDHWRHFRSLRKNVTVLVTAVVAFPLCAAAVITATMLRNEAMQFENAPVKRSALCVSGMVADSVHDEPHIPGTRTGDSPLAIYGHVCKEGVYGLATIPERSGDIGSADLSDPDNAFYSMASYDSTAFIPELSLWPITDPDAIGYRAMRDSGAVSAGIPAILSPVEAGKIASVQRELNHRILWLATGVLILCAMLAAAVWVAAGFVLRPVEAIRRKVAEITEHDLSGRVVVPRACNEITSLAITMNSTLDRLQNAVEQNQRFVADASHELRSPIAALRAELEIALAHPHLTNWTDILDSALSYTYRLQELATDLLLLTRLDHIPTAASSAPVDLGTLVRTEIRRHRSRHTIISDIDNRPTVVHGSRTLLARLLGNLLDNAERHATDTITVTLCSTDVDAVLEVVDNGPGIPPEDRERVFDRFTRLDDTRSRDTGGTGLGLPIARRIATVHRGTLHATHHTDGARLTATIPLVPPEVHPERWTGAYEIQAAARSDFS